ncbi:MAG: hypothetical protein ACM3NO_03395 [Deltaproteobacteria bacterium]
MKHKICLAIMLSISSIVFAQDKPAAIPDPNQGSDKSTGTVQTTGAAANKHATAAAQESGSSPTPLIFGDAHFTIPAGWRHRETLTGANKIKVMLIVPPDVTPKQNLSVLMLPAQDLEGADFAQAVDKILKQALAPNEHLIKFSELPARRAGDYDLLTRTMVVSDDAGHRSVRICFAADPGHRLEMMFVSADSQETLKHYQADVAVLLNSLSYGDSPAPPEMEEKASGVAQAPSGTGSEAKSQESAESGTVGKPAQSTPANGPQSVAPGIRTRVAADESVLLCTDPARLDGAMDFAKYGDSYNALRALRNDAFFRVTGPATLVVKESDLKSRWPKVFVTVLDGDSAGRTGWVVLSELKDLKPPAK